MLYITHADLKADTESSSLPLYQVVHLYVFCSGSFYCSFVSFLVGFSLTHVIHLRLLEQSGTQKERRPRLWEITKAKPLLLHEHKAACTQFTLKDATALSYAFISAVSSQMSESSLWKTTKTLVHMHFIKDFGIICYVSNQTPKKMTLVRSCIVLVNFYWFIIYTTLHKIT